MDKYVNVGSRKIRYTRDGSGPNVILIHGLGGSIEWWSANIPALAEHFTVYALDLPGFGMSDRLDQDKTIEFFSRFTEQFLDTLKIDSASLVGHSMGGYIATRTALEYRHRVDSLVMVNSGGFGRIHNPLMKTLDLPFIDKIMNLPLKLGIRLVIRSMVYNKNVVTQDLIDTAYRHSKRPGANEGILRILRAGNAFSQTSNKMFTAHEIRTLSMPTMVIWGDRDSVFPSSQAERAHSLLPNSQLHIIDKCGHLPQLEYPQKFNELVCRFLLSPGG